MDDLIPFATIGVARPTAQPAPAPDFGDGAGFEWHFSGSGNAPRGPARRDHNGNDLSDDRSNKATVLPADDDSSDRPMGADTASDATPADPVIAPPVMSTGLRQQVFSDRALQDRIQTTGPQGPRSGAIAIPADPAGPNMPDTPGSGLGVASSGGRIATTAARETSFLPIRSGPPTMTTMTTLTSSNPPATTPASDSIAVSPNPDTTLTLASQTPRRVGLRLADQGAPNVQGPSKPPANLSPAPPQDIFATPQVTKAASPMPMPPSMPIPADPLVRPVAGAPPAPPALTGDASLPGQAVVPVAGLVSPHAKTAANTPNMANPGDAAGTRVADGGGRSGGGPLPRADLDVPFLAMTKTMAKAGDLVRPRVEDTEKPNTVPGDDRQGRFTPDKGQARATQHGLDVAAAAVRSGGQPWPSVVPGVPDDPVSEMAQTATFSQDDRRANAPLIVPTSRRPASFGPGARTQQQTGSFPYLVPSPVPQGAQARVDAANLGTKAAPPLAHAPSTAWTPSSEPPAAKLLRHPPQPSTSIAPTPAMIIAKPPLPHASPLPPQELPGATFRGPVAPTPGDRSEIAVPTTPTTTTTSRTALSAPPIAVALGPPMPDRQTPPAGPMPDMPLGLGLGLGPDEVGMSGLSQTASPAPMPVAPGAAAQATGVMQQVAVAFREQPMEPGTPLELALDPPELGRVRMSVTEIGGTLTLTITAERPETAELMRRHLNLLAEEFGRAGVDAPNVQISHGGQGGQGETGRKDGGSQVPLNAGGAGTGLQDTPEPGAISTLRHGAEPGLDLRL